MSKKGKNKLQGVESTKVEGKIIYSDIQAKDVFHAIMEEYSDGVTNAINQLSVSKGYGEADSSIQVVGDDIHIDMRNKSKGLVLTKDGFLNYSDIPVGSRYMEIKQGKPAVSTKRGLDEIDILIGFAPDITQVRVALEEDISIKSVIEAMN